MNTKIKSIAILLATLGIGVFVGASITGALVRTRLEYVRAFGQQDGFVERFNELIGPVSVEQQAQIDPLLEAAGRDISDLVKSSNTEFKQIISKLDTELSSILTEEQLANLEEERRKARNLYFGRYTTVTGNAPHNDE